MAFQSCLLVTKKILLAKHCLNNSIKFTFCDPHNQEELQHQSVCIHNAHLAFTNEQFITNPGSRAVFVSCPQIRDDFMVVAGLAAVDRNQQCWQHNRLLTSCISNWWLILIWHKTHTHANISIIITMQCWSLLQFATRMTCLPPAPDRQSPIFPCPGRSNESRWNKVDLSTPPIGRWLDTNLSIGTGQKDLVCKSGNVAK